MRWLLTTDNLSQHTQHYKDLNLERDFVQEYLESLLPWESVPGTPFVDQSELETTNKEQATMLPASKRSHGNHNHQTYRNHKRQTNASRPQQPMRSPVGGPQGETDLPTTAKRKTSDMKQSVLDTNSTPISPDAPIPLKDDISRTRRKKAAKKARQEEQRSKRRRKQASPETSELEDVAREIQQLDVRQSGSNIHVTQRRQEVSPSHDGPVTRSRSFQHDTKNHKVSNVAQAPARLRTVDARAKNRGLRHSPSELEDQQNRPNEPSPINSGSPKDDQQKKALLPQPNVQQRLHGGSANYKRLLHNTTKACQDLNLSDTCTPHEESKTSPHLSAEHSGRRRIKDASKARKVLASSSLLMNQFSAPGISNSRITLHEHKNERLGIFNKGKASTKTTVPREFTESVFLGRISPISGNTRQVPRHNDHNPFTSSAEQTTSSFFNDSREIPVHHHDASQQPYDSPHLVRHNSCYQPTENALQLSASLPYRRSRASSGLGTSHAPHETAVATQQHSPTGQSCVQCDSPLQSTNVHLRPATPEDVVDEILDSLKENALSASPRLLIQSIEPSHMPCSTPPMSSSLPHTVHMSLPLPVTYVTQDGFYSQPAIHFAPVPQLRYTWDQQGHVPLDVNGDPTPMLSPMIREERPVLLPLYMDRPWAPEPVAVGGVVYCQQEPGINPTAPQSLEPCPPSAPMISAGPCGLDAMHCSSMGTQVTAPFKSVGPPPYIPGYARVSYGNGPCEWRVPY